MSKARDMSGSMVVVDRAGGDDVGGGIVVVGDVVVGASAIDGEAVDGALGSPSATEGVVANDAFVLGVGSGGAVVVVRITLGGETDPPDPIDTAVPFSTKVRVAAGCAEEHDESTQKEAVALSFANNRAQTVK